LQRHQSFLGVDTPINDITTEQCRNLRDIIKKMPKNYHQKYARTGKTIGDVIANEKYEVLAAKTISKYWAWIKAFFEWCYIEDYANANVAQKLTVENAKSSINDRMPFNKEQLETFFNSPQYVGHGKHRTQEGDEVIKDTMYWMPLVALYTGARLGELVTLQCKDIIKQDRFYYISINTNSDLKNLKTKQSERVIPIHPDLLEIGFIKYVEEQNNKHGENSRLFHHIPIPKNAGASHTATKRFKTYINGIGLGNSGVVFHSFRHNFADSMRRAEIDAERMDALTGHKQMSGKNARAIYGSKFRPQDLYPSICKMRFEVDLSHLK